MSDFHTPRRLPKWLGALLCLFGEHRWYVNSDNTWRSCGCCRIEETRLSTQVWKS